MRMIECQGKLIRHVVLVNPGPDSAESASSSACFPPLGLLSLATVLKKYVPDLEVTVLDQCAHGSDLIIDAFRPGQIVGISALTTTYLNSLRFAEAAAGTGCLVVMGNDHASKFSEIILQKRPVSAVLVGDSVEFSFANLVKSLLGSEPLENVHGVVARTAEGLVSFPPSRVPLSMIPIPDRSLLDHSYYKSVFMDKFSPILGLASALPTTTNFCKGCSKVRDRCSFCDIYDLSLDHVPPERVWQELSELTEQGFNYFWEVGDSFTSHLPWLRKLVHLKPEGMSFDLFVYARAQELTNIDTVCLLRELGVRRVNIGMESGDDDALRVFNKGNRSGSETNLRAAENLAVVGMKAHISLILGCPGETESSLVRTMELVAKLLDMGVLTSVDPSILYPLPGAPLWKLVEKSGKFKDALCTDVLPADLRQRFVREFCHVTIEELDSARTQINRLALNHGRLPGGFG